MNQMLDDNTRKDFEKYIAVNGAEFDQLLPDLEAKVKFAQMLTNLTNGEKYTDLRVKVVAKLLLVYLGKELIDIDDIEREKL